MKVLRCSACGKLNISTNHKCKKCGADLEQDRPDEAAITLTICLYTGTMCKNPCAMARVENKSLQAAWCIKSAANPNKRKPENRYVP
jgi:uncharacterized protein (DUF983 family)